MARPQDVARSIRAFADAKLSPAGLSANLARIARGARDDLIARGDASPAYDTYVDGRHNAAEETVKPTGAIFYQFNLLGLAAVLAVSEAIARSPAHSGRFRKSWLVAVDGVPWRGDLAEIPFNATVWVTNPQPYARKIEVGAMRMSVPPGIVEAVRQLVQKRFPRLAVQRRFVNIPAGAGGGYVLRSGSGDRRRDRQAGAPLTYPALEITFRL